MIYIKFHIGIIIAIIALETRPRIYEISFKQNKLTHCNSIYLLKILFTSSEKFEIIV